LKADKAYGKGVATALGIPLSEVKQAERRFDKNSLRTINKPSP
jgi:hypothetical protein